MRPLSVILCTHNPRRDHLERTLAALRAQTLPQDAWELLLVDNASSPALASQIDLAWHVTARVVAEPVLGLVAARLRGIAEATGETLVFVDDDNVLAPDYLEQAARLAREKPHVGAWGGSIEPAYEVAPPALVRERPWLLACVRVDADRWSNHAQPGGCLPVGAGLCVRASVARAYADRVTGDPVRRALDRVGAELASAGDADLALTACDLGLAAGQFRALRLTHLIGAGRLQPEYLLRLAESLARSQTVLLSLRASGLGRPPYSRFDHAVRWWRSRRLSASTRAFEAAWRRGEQAAYALLAQQRPAGAGPS